MFERTNRPTFASLLFCLPVFPHLFNGTQVRRSGGVLCVRFGFDVIYVVFPSHSFVARALYGDASSCTNVQFRSLEPKTPLKSGFAFFRSAGYLCLDRSSVEMDERALFCTLVGFVRAPWKGFIEHSRVVLKLCVLGVLELVHRAHRTAASRPQPTFFGLALRHSRLPQRRELSSRHVSCSWTAWRGVVCSKIGKQVTSSLQHMLSNSQRVRH